jgi:hypothetical protein
MAAIPLTRGTWTAIPISQAGTLSMTNPSAAPIYVRLMVGGVGTKWMKCQPGQPATMAVPASASVQACAGASCSSISTVA